MRRNRGLYNAAYTSVGATNGSGAFQPAERRGSGGKGASSSGSESGPGGVVMNKPEVTTNVYVWRGGKAANEVVMEANSRAHMLKWRMNKLRNLKALMEAERLHTVTIERPVSAPGATGSQGRKVRPLDAHYHAYKQGNAMPALGGAHASSSSSGPSAPSE